MTSGRILHIKTITMSRIKSISIPQPCHQSWQQMQPVERGRHCEHCCKTVTDFTKMTHEEIVTYLSATRNVCGRIEPGQLTAVNYLLQYQRRSVFTLKKFGWAAAILLSVPVIRACAQEPVRLMGKVKIAGTVRKTVTGVVIARDDKLPIPGVSIQVKGHKVGTQTDADGRFKIDVPGDCDTLTVRSVGYQSQEISLDKFEPRVEGIPLKLVDTLVLKTAMTGGLVAKRSFFGEIWYYIKWPVRAIFRHGYYWR